MLLWYGSSAAFWQCAWWRSIVGFRWVRKEDLMDSLEFAPYPSLLG